MTQGSAAGTTRILIVDDEPFIRDFIEDGLTRAGYQCSAAESASDAATVLKESKFDLVLLDINMPIKTGIEYLPELLSEHPDIAVVILTGEADLQTAIGAMRQGAYDYISKPVGLAPLTIRVENALSKRALLIENRMYEQRQEELVDELSTLLANRKREVESLIKLFQSQVVQKDSDPKEYDGLTKSLAEFTSRLERLATGARKSSENS